MMIITVPVLLSFACTVSLATSFGWKESYPSERLAIARMFFAADFDSLVESFQKWPHPCHGGAATSSDLFLVYSGDLNNDKELLGRVEEVAELIGAAYSQCFGSVRWISCNILKDADVYNRKLQHDRQDWVNGPNRQFEITFRLLQTMGYDKMFLMEADTVPLKSFWLDLLLEEIKVKAPFSMLGSTYKGDKWDSFRKVLPEALLRHLNGNAIYDLKDQRLDRIVQQLEHEVNTTGNGIPYDYRIAQIVVEAKEGVVPDLPTYPGFHDPIRQDLLDYLGFDDASTSEILKTTRLIANYAETNMITEYFDKDAVFVHGAHMFQSWKTSPYTGSLTLVISDYSGESPHKELLKQIDQINTLPFNRLLLALPFSTEHRVLDEVSMSLPVDVFHREPFKDSLNDYCDVLASLKTDWFILTDSHARMTSKMTLMVTEDNGKPLASFVDASMAKCDDDFFCSEELIASQEFLPGNDHIFRSDDTVFSVDAMKKYCSLIGGRRPSATDYFAFLEKHQMGTTLYAFSNRANRGSRLPFRQYYAPELEVVSMAEQRRSLQAPNITECEKIVNETVCEAAIGCDWVPAFGTCIDRVEVAIFVSITIGPVDLTAPTTTDVQVLENACSKFFSAKLNTIAVCTIGPLTDIIFTSNVRRMLQAAAGTFLIEFKVTVRLTDVLSNANIAGTAGTLLAASSEELINEIRTSAIATQGESSSLDDINSLVVEDISLVDPSGPEPGKCEGITWFGKIFCVLIQAFGSVGSFIKWVVNILTFGIFS